MSLSPDQIDAVHAAIDKMNEGLRDLVNACADEGEPEMVERAIVMFEAQGMAESGLFYRRDYIKLEDNGHRTAMLGMLDLLTEKARHDLTCEGHEE